MDTADEFDAIGVYSKAQCRFNATKLDAFMVRRESTLWQLSSMAHRFEELLSALQSGRYDIAVAEVGLTGSAEEEAADCGRDTHLCGIQSARRGAQWTTGRRGSFVCACVYHCCGENTSVLRV